MQKQKMLSILLVFAMLIQMMSGLAVVADSGYFEVALDDMTAGVYTSTTIENIQEYVPEEMRFALAYCSTSSRYAQFTFENSNGRWWYHDFDTLLTCVDEASGQYNLKIPFFNDLPTGAYTLTIEYQVTDEGANLGAKPFKFYINEYITDNPAAESGYFEWHIPDISSEWDGITYISELQDYLPESMQFGLVYASTGYEDNIYTPARFSFESAEVSEIYEIYDVPLTYDSYGHFTLEIPYFSDLPSGTYTLMIDLDVANEKGVGYSYDVKPYKFVFDNFVVNNSLIESAVYEYTIGDAELDAYSSVTVDGLENILPENMADGLQYVSLENSGILFTFELYGETIEREEYGKMLFSRDENDSYSLKIPFLNQLPTGTHDVMITLPVVGDHPDAKKFKLHLNYTINNPACESGVFEWTLPDMVAQPGTTVAVNNVQKLLPDGMHFGMYYTSSWYNSSLTSPVSFTFAGSSVTHGYNQATSPLIIDNANVPEAERNYTLYIPVSEAYSDGTYALEIMLPCASAKGNDDVRPIVLKINNFVVKSAGNDHAWDEGRITLRPSCESTGTKLYTCICGCGDTMTEEIPALGHDYPDEWTVEREPTCTVSGQEMKECGRCMLAKEVRTIRPLGHDYASEWTEDVQPTCTQDGSESRHCVRCDATTDERPIESEGHSWTGWYVRTAPTATADGLKVRRCEVCQTEETEVIDALGVMNTTFTVADTSTLEAIAGAEIFVSNADGSVNLKIVSDQSGKAYVDLANGAYSVQIFAKGYQMRNFVIEKKDDVSQFTPYLSKNSVVDVNTVVKEMTYQEIIDAGIDIDAEENQHIYKCSTVLKFTPIDSGDGSITIIPIEINFDYYCDDAGTVIKADPIFTGGAVIYPVSRDIYLIIYSHTTWLKEIFDVQLVVTNTSVAESIEDCVASLELPEGLSLAVMTEAQQSLCVNMDDIAPQSAGDVHWYICGDKEGEYYLSGMFNGIRSGGGITEALDIPFTTSEPINVLAGSAMKLTVEAEKTAYPGMPYKVRYTLQNVSSKTLYNVALDVLGGKFMKAYDVRDIIHEAQIGEPEGVTGEFNNGVKLKDGSFEPGEILSGVFEVTFGVGVPTENVKYMVTDMFTVTGNGSTTEIPTEIILADNVINHKWNEGVVSVEAGCETEGQRIYTCSGCGETLVTVIPPKGHDFNDWHTTIEATCTTEGEESRECSDCDCIRTRPISKIPHTNDEGKITTHSTETAHGVITYTCLVCRETYEEEAPLLAAGGYIADSSIEWRMYEDGAMYVSGEGIMTDFASAAGAPWADIRSEIEEVIIEDGVTQIGKQAFAKCTNLKKVVIPEGVNTLKAAAFKDCLSLTEIILPDSVTTIGQNAFLNCSSLKEFIIPKDVTIIKNNAFSGCSSLDTIYFGGARSDWESIRINEGNDLLKDEFIYYEIPSVELSAESVSVYAPKEECVLWVVTYRGNALVDSKLINVTSSIEKTVEEIGVNTLDTDTFKVFLWGDMSSLTPLCTGTGMKVNP